MNTRKFSRAEADDESGYIPVAKFWEVDALVKRALENEQSDSEVRKLIFEASLRTKASHIVEKSRLVKSRRHLRAAMDAALVRRAKGKKTRWHYLRGDRVLRLRAVEVLLESMAQKWKRSPPIRNEFPLTNTPLSKVLSEGEFIPQAVLSLPISTFADRTGVMLEHGADGLGAYQGVGYSLSTINFCVLHYQGHPPNTSSVYLPAKYTNVTLITALLKWILTSLKVPNNAILWQRKDDPEL